MPIDRILYPADWSDLVLRVRERARGRCECIGLCGLHGPLCRRCLFPQDGSARGRDCGRSVHVPQMNGRATWCLICGPDVCSLYLPGSIRRCREMEGQPAAWARGLVRLTTAHLNAPGGPCTCSPLCSRDDHVLAMCAKCHLRYDAPRHAVTRSATAERRSGQIRLLPRPLIDKESP